MTDSFKRECICIIDCFEVFCERPSDLMARAQNAIFVEFGSCIDCFYKERIILFNSVEYKFITFPYYKIHITQFHLKLYLIEVCMLSLQNISTILRSL